MSDRTTIALGPPGTGKTTWLLDQVNNALQTGIPPQRIAYLGFTRKSAHEPVMRAKERFGFTDEEFPYFRTLHSLAYRQLGLTKEQLMQNVHYDELGRVLGVAFQHHYDEGVERVPPGGGFGDRCLRIYGLARARQQELEDAWRDADEPNLPFRLLRDFCDALDHYKSVNGLLDFTDFLDQCYSELDVDLFILDEAQDLTKQQWDFARRAGTSAPKVLIAGDDDQAIFQWSGADVRTFLSLSGERIVLPTSYRLPRSVFQLVQSLAQRIQLRVPKTWNPREEDGEVTWVTDPDQADLTQGTWLLLARQRYQLKEMEAIARSHGVVYQIDGHWSNEERFVKAILYYERMRRGESISKAFAETVVRFTSKFEVPKGEGPFSTKDFTVPWEAWPEWIDALDRLGFENREYVRALRANGESLVKPGRVTLSTIHGVKGGEADNVMLLTDITKRVHDGSLKDADAELRVWFVACSRARHKLFLVSPKTPRFFEI